MSNCWNYANLDGWHEQVGFLQSWADQVRGPDEWYRRWHISEVKELSKFKEHLDWWDEQCMIPNEFFILRLWQTDLNISDVNNLKCPKIHTDHQYQDDLGGKSGIDPTYSINIPLRNCEGTSTHFYEIKDIHKQSLVEYYGVEGEYGIDPKICKQIDFYYLTKPIIMNVKIPHCIHNPLSTIREVMCFRFANDYKLESWL